MNKIYEFIDKANEELKRFKDIPFGQSMFQNLILTHSEDFSQPRKIRTLVLQLYSKLENLELNLIEIEKQKLQLKKLKIKLKSCTDDIESEEINLEIKKIITIIKYREKILKDNFREVYELYSFVKTLPTVTKEEFEKEEYNHYKTKLTKQIKEPQQITIMQAMEESKQQINKLIETKELQALLSQIESDYPTLNEENSVDNLYQIEPT